MVSALIAVLAAVAVAPPEGAAPTLVVCSPGSPGSTEQAQPTMDEFAAVLARAAGRSPGSLAAIYHEGEQPGLERIAAGDAALALVPLPFLLQHGANLGLTPLAEAIPASGEREVWSLVARRGAVPSPAGLAGWEVTGGPGYAPPFVRRIVPGAWGVLPEAARVTFASRILTALRRAAAGENVAVVLDREQSEALGALPFAADLEVVTRSRPVPVAFLCAVRSRLPEPESKAILDALLRLHDRPDGREVLETMRLSRFGPVDTAALASARTAFAGTPR